MGVLINLLGGVNRLMYRSGSTRGTRLGRRRIPPRERPLPKRASRGDVEWLRAQEREGEGVWFRFKELIAEDPPLEGRVEDLLGGRGTFAGLLKPGAGR